MRCLSRRTRSGSGGTVGPDLGALGTDREAVRRSIREPGAVLVFGFPNVMPELEMTDDELEAVIDLLIGTE
ncbi:MAG TPA: hypothetical protein VLG28_18245 [Acidimicrobiia bacterium]|jgi:hypothetical protein|nr:hypothetical protein [Acidimicrobiia bacterium]